LCESGGLTPAAPDLSYRQTASQAETVASELRGTEMAEPTGCSWCSEDVDRYRLARHLDWAGAVHAFCCFLCEFFWRRARIAEAAHAERASAAFSFLR
jgi:hypothetical protein